MRFLRDLYRRGPIGRFFDGLSPVDRATFLIIVGLAFAFAFSVHGLWARWARPEPIAPAAQEPAPATPAVRA